MLTVTLSNQTIQLLNDLNDELSDGTNNELTSKEVQRIINKMVIENRTADDVILYYVLDPAA